MLLLHKSWLSLAILTVPCCVLFVSNEKHLRLNLQEKDRLDELLVVPSDELNLTAVEIAFEQSQTELPLPDADKEWRCGYSQPHCNRTKAEAQYRKHVVRKVFAINEIRAQLKASNRCSCQSAMSGAYFCCQKAMIVVHKMGLTAVQDLKNEFFKKLLFARVTTVEIMSDHTIGRRFEYEFLQPFAADYRHVVVTRNWYDSIISGYLYHKAGKECWLNWFGQPGHDGWLLKNSDEDWERRLRHSNNTLIQRLRWHPGNGRDLCQFLAEESEEDGLRVYAAWALASYMHPLLDFRHRRLEFERQEKLNRTMFLCYEQLANPGSYSSTVFSIYQWLHPSKIPLLNASNPNLTYQGGHASDHDPQLRIRLRKALATLDTDFFNGAITAGSAEFGCRATYE